MENNYYVDGVGNFYIKQGMPRLELDVNKDYNSLEEINILIEDVQKSMNIYPTGSNKQLQTYGRELSKRELLLRELRDIRSNMIIKLFMENKIDVMQLINSLTDDTIEESLEAFKQDNNDLETIVKKLK